MVEAPSYRPSTSCDLDTMDLDQLRREKLKMQIKVLRLQEEHYALIVEGHKTWKFFIRAWLYSWLQQENWVSQGKLMAFAGLSEHSSQLSKSSSSSSLSVSPSVEGRRMYLLWTWNNKNNHARWYQHEHRCASKVLWASGTSVHRTLALSTELAGAPVMFWKDTWWWFQPF